MVLTGHARGQALFRSQAIYTAISEVALLPTCMHRRGAEGTRLVACLENAACCGAAGRRSSKNKVSDRH